MVLMGHSKLPKAISSARLFLLADFSRPVQVLSVDLPSYYARLVVCRWTL